MQRRKAPPQITLTSDASGSWGCGAYSSKGEWFALKWPDSWVKIHITVKELLPIVMGIAIWGWQWSGKPWGYHFSNSQM